MSIQFDPTSFIPYTLAAKGFISERSDRAAKCRVIRSELDRPIPYRHKPLTARLPSVASVLRKAAFVTVWTISAAICEV
jgi:hypothetical protein